MGEQFDAQQLPNVDDVENLVESKLRGRVAMNESINLYLPDGDGGLVVRSIVPVISPEENYAALILSFNEAIWNETRHLHYYCLWSDGSKSKVEMFGNEIPRISYK